VAENTTIWYRGASYELGRGLSFYGIWPAGGGQSHPFEWWPLTPEGWAGAWARFTTIEAPTAIIQLKAPPRPGEGEAGSATQPAGGASTAAQAGQPSGDMQAGMTWAAGSKVTDATRTDTLASTGPGPDAAAAGAGPGRAPGRQPTSLLGQLRADGLTRRPGAAVGLGLTGLGVLLGIAGLFPAYTGGSSLAAQAATLVPHLIYLAGWAAAAVLILAGGTRQRAGALLGLGLGVVSFGLFFADAGFPIAGHGTAGAGLMLSIAGWAVATAGSAVALWQPGLPRSASRPAAAQAAASPWAPAYPAGQQSARWRQGRWQRGWPAGQRAEIGPALTVVLAAILVAITFAFPWDRYTLSTPAGFLRVITLGNAFSNPAPVIAGNVLVMVALVAVAIVAALWRPARYGVALAAGAAIPMVAQGIAALIGAAEPTSPTQFGIPEAQARQAGLTISSGLTAAFWFYCLVLGVLLLSLVWLLVTPGPAATRPAVPGRPGWQPAAPGPQGFAQAEPVRATSPWQATPADQVPSAAAPGPHWPARPAGQPAGPGGEDAG
jgi:hypothetical protein